MLKRGRKRSSSEIKRLKSKLASEKSKNDVLDGMITELSDVISGQTNQISDLQERICRMETELDTDIMTGVRSRKALFAIMDKFTPFNSQNTRRSNDGKGTTVLFVDFDNFTDVNTQLGHAGGDKALILCAQTLESVVRDSDDVARYGGDEFVVLLYDTTTNEAMMVAEKARASIEGMQFEFKVTVSIGVAHVRENETLSECVVRADRAAYMSKNNGRNRVTSFRGDMEGRPEEKLKERVG